jgi:hypothetical protein
LKRSAASKYKRGKMINTIKLITLAILICISFLAINAQEQTFISNNETSSVKTDEQRTKQKQSSAKDEYFKTEVSGGYSWLKPNQDTIGLAKETNLNGYEASVTRNLQRFVGIKFSTGGNFAKSSTVSTGGTDTRKQSFYTFLGGIQVKDNRKSTRLKPFAHVLTGVSHFRDVYKTTFGSGFTSTNTQTAFTIAFGGGLDIRVNKTISVRPVQFDYLINASTDIIPRSLVRLGAGINFHF